MRELRVVVIGAGMAGILAAIKLREAGISDITVYEKADNIGGTWRENTYPGLTCDVPSHHYTYSFERNPDWTRHLPPGAEIQAYFENISAKYKIGEVLRFNTGIARADYRDGRWQLLTEHGEQDSADVVIAATGVLHYPSYPKIPGMDDFEGAIFHTARWDHSVPLAGKRIGVIGMGSTGVQIVSALAGKAALVEHYVRTPQWIMPTVNGYYSEDERAAFRADPAVLAQAMDVEGYNAGVEMYTRCLTEPEGDEAKMWHQACYDNLDQSVLDPVLREKLRPDHKPLCKRLIFSPDYYQAIQHPQASLVTEDIERIEAKGIRTKDGQLHELDVIALATGFRADQFMRPMQITGRDGLDLETLWAKRPVAYRAIAMPDFPNFFMLNGPSGPVGNFSLIEIAELQWGYIAQLLELLRSGKYREIAPDHAAMETYEQARIAAAKTTIWYTGGCQSWYLDAEGIPASWPWNFSRFIADMSAPQLDHWQLL